MHINTRPAKLPSNAICSLMNHTPMVTENHAISSKISDQNERMNFRQIARSHNTRTDRHTNMYVHVNTQYIDTTINTSKLNPNNNTQTEYIHEYASVVQSMST